MSRRRGLGSFVAGLLALALLAGACSSSSSGGEDAAQASSATTAPGAPEAVTIRTVPLPDGVEPELPSFTADGEHLVFDFTGPGAEGHQVGTVAIDGSDFTCVTCGIGGLDVGKTFLSADDTRVLVRSPGGKGVPTTMYGYDILECPNGVLDCPSPTVVPIELPGKAEGVLQNRELRLAPDGEHIVFTQVRPGGWTMVLGRLVKVDDHFELTDLRLLNPQFDLGDQATDWAAAGAFYEAKGFTHDGQGVIYASTRDSSLNFDDYLLDLRTGERTRLTRHPDWDEPLDISPDGSTIVVGSSRGTHRIDAMSQVARPPLFDLITYSQTARWLLSTEARDCVVRPWLLATAVADTDQPGQELDVTSWDEGYGPRAIPSWSADGTKIAFWDELQDPSKAPSGAPGARLRVATLDDRRPTAPTEVQPTPVPAWAWTYDQYPLTARTAQQTIDGPGGGTATISFDGDFVKGTYEVTYDDYSDDGRTFLDGTESIDNRSIISSATYAVDLTLTGERQGSMKGGFTLEGTKLDGAVTSVVDGQRLTWPPPACPPPSAAG